MTQKPSTVRVVDKVKVKPTHLAQVCPVCNGFGTLRHGTKTCQACDGKGYIFIPAEEVLK